MTATSAKIEDGSGIPAVESKGTQAASTDSERGIIKVCKHAFCGCISAKGYTCTHTGPCEPMDDNGKRFEVRYTVENGQRFMHRVQPVIDAEKQQVENLLAQGKEYQRTGNKDAFLKPVVVAR